MSNKIRVIFTLSVMLNVLFIGIGASAVYKKHQHKQQIYSKKIPQGVSEQAREIMKNTHKQARSENKEIIQNAMQNRKDMMQIIASDDFDPQAYDEMVDKMMKDQKLLAQKKGEFVKSMMEQMNTDDRKALAHKMSGLIGGERPRRHNNRDKMQRGDFNADKMDPERIKKWREMRQKRMGEEGSSERDLEFDRMPAPPSKDSAVDELNEQAQPTETPE